MPSWRRSDLTGSLSTPGTRVNACRFTIPRNQFYIDIRKAKRAVEGANGFTPRRSPHRWSATEERFAGALGWVGADRVDGFRLTRRWDHLGVRRLQRQRCVFGPGMRGDGTGLKR